MKLKRLKSGNYITSDGRFMFEKYDGFWLAVDVETGQSVVYSEDKFRLIKEALEKHVEALNRNA